MSYFNSDQEDYMRYLSTLPPEKKCACGWYPIGECPHEACKRKFAEHEQGKGGTR